jgi:UDP-N-acetyl-D-galactosamine dehydrogenase
MDSNIKIAVIGLGYVGLPLARLFATKYAVVGYDINQTRVAALQSGSDSTFEVDEVTLQNVLVSAQLMPQVCIAPLT